MVSSIPVKINGTVLLLLTLLLGIVVGYTISRQGLMSEGFTDTMPLCSSCKKKKPCGCGAAGSNCPTLPDMSKYVLKTTVPPCPRLPNMSQYMLKTECPPSPDLSKYVLKSSIPKPQPVIIDNSSCRKDCGTCPPCPRPRCPQVNCPSAPACPTCPPCARAVCPPQQVKCTATDTTQSTVRPFLAPLNFQTFGTG